MTERSSQTIVVLAWVFYVPMIFSAYFARPPGGLVITDWESLALGSGAAVLGGMGVIAFSRHVSRGTAWGRGLFREFHSILAGLDSRQILMLSLLSAFGEEALFRGVLHPRLGLIWTALIFAGFHFPYRRGLAPWTLFAGVLGVALGALVDFSGSLWPAVLLHFLINYFNLHDLVEHEPPEDPATPPEKDAAPPTEGQSGEPPG